jgi:hypothetical protein
MLSRKVDECKPLPVRRVSAASTSPCTVASPCGWYWNPKYRAPSYDTL